MFIQKSLNILGKSKDEQMFYREMFHLTLEIPFGPNSDNFFAM